jgi:hypothetical protein
MQPPNPKTNPTLSHSTPCRAVVARRLVHALTLPLAFGAAFALTAGLAYAQTWQTVDDFQLAPGQDAANYGLAFDPHGTLFASGLAMDSAGLGHGLVMSSTDNGNTWSAPVDDYTYAPGYAAWYDGGMVIDPGGNIYVAGEAWNNSGTDPMNHWVVRRSADGGNSWSTVDDFTGLTAAPSGIAVDAAGNVYVAGIGNPACANCGAELWTVRKGVGGANFSIVDQPVALTGGWSASANAVFVHPTAGVFVAGYGQIPWSSGPKSGTSQGWVVRRSTDGGVTWSTVDAFHLLSTYDARPYGLGADARGNLYVVGTAIGTGVLTGKNKGNRWHWIVRKSPDGGNSWSTVDDYLFSMNGGSAASKFVADAIGNLYVAGMGNTTGGQTGNWIVRSSPGGTGTWTTVDNYVYAPGDSANWPWAIAMNASGNVFVGGELSEGNGWHWVVRRE